MLVVETNKKAQTRLKRALKGLKVLIAEDAALAKVQVENARPDVIVMDIELPDRTGFELCRYLEMRDATRHIPVLFVGKVDQFDAGSAAAFERVVTFDDLAALESRVVSVTAQAELDRRVRAALRRAMPSGPATRTGLSEPEADALKSGGLDVDAEVDVTPLARHAATYQSIWKRSLTTAAAAKRLRVSEARVRQKLGSEPPSIHGIRDGRVWRIPAFQFTRRGMVPGIAAVIRRLDPDLDPVSVDHWFRTKNVDLEIGDEHVSPLEWLSAGRKPQIVAELASDVGTGA